MPVQKVPNEWGDMLNLKPTAFGTSDIPPDPVPPNFGLPDPNNPKAYNWQQWLIDLKDVPLPKHPEDIGKSLIFEPHPDLEDGSKSFYTVKWGIPARLETPRSFSITGDGEAPAVQFDGTQNVTLELTNLQAAKWKTPRTMEFIGTDATGSVTFDGSGNVSVTLDVKNSDNAASAARWTTARTVTITGGDATGNFTIDGSSNVNFPINVLNSDNAAHADVVTLSPDSGNLLQQRGNGLYFGEVSPAEFADMYIDAINGNDANPGTRLLPKQTIKGTLDVGPPGIGRRINLYESQEHFVNPTAPAILRGGSCYFKPYGPTIDSLPPLPGRNPWDSEAARNLNTRISSLPFATVTIGSANYQAAPALVGAGRAVMTYAGLTLIAGVPNGSGLPVSSEGGTFASTEGNNTIQTDYSSVVLPDALSRLMCDSPASMVTYSTFVSIFSGSGKIVANPTNNVAVINRGSDAAAPPATIAGYMAGVLKAPEVLYNITTNLDPALFP